MNIDAGSLAVSNIDTNVIPKKIHYVWMGGAPKNDLALRCIESWKKYMPDYEIIEWNESNFDVDAFDYTRQAYEQKKWAFVSDAVRTYALKEYGGVYFDTDVELFCTPGDIFQNADVVLGFDNRFLLSTGVMVAVPQHPVFQKLWSVYQTSHFLNAMDESTINTKLTCIVVDYLQTKRITDGKYFINGVKLLPTQYFSNNNTNDKTPVFAIHYFAGSWKAKTELTDFQYFVLRCQFALLRLTSRFMGNKTYLTINDSIWRNALKKTLRNHEKGVQANHVL